MTKRMDPQTLEFSIVYALDIFPLLFLSRDPFMLYILVSPTNFAPKKACCYGISANETPGPLMNNQSEADLYIAAEHFPVINIYTTGHIIQGGRNWFLHKLCIKILQVKDDKGSDVYVFACVGSAGFGEN